MRYLFNLVIGILLVIVVLLLIHAFCLTFTFTDVKFPYYQVNKDFLPSAIFGTGVLVALLTFIREKLKQEGEKRRNSSKIFLERAILAFDTSLSLLADHNNDRIVWLRAARTLLKADALKKRILDPDYQLTYSMEAERVRSELYETLSVQDPETGERGPLPQQFFYGVSDWKSKEPLDVVAIQASPEGEVYEITIDQLTPGAGIKPIAPNSIVAIYDFMKYPEDYADPLDAVTVWSNDWLDSYGHSEGAQKYVAHRNKYRVQGSKLLENHGKSN